MKQVKWTLGSRNREYKGRIVCKSAVYFNASVVLLEKTTINGIETVYNPAQIQRIPTKSIYSR